MFIAKGFSSIGAIIITVIGVGMLGITIWAMKNSQFTFDNYTFLGVLLGIDFLIIGAGVIGFCGTKRANGCLLAIFTIFVLLFFCIFLGLGIFAQVSPKYLFDGDCKSSQHNILIQQAYNASVLSKYLCTAACPCALTQSAIDKNGYSLVQKAALALYAKADNGAKSFQQCKIADINATQYQKAFDILYAVQHALSCAGWCENQTSLVYRFSDVNWGKPEATCYIRMKQYTQEYSVIIGTALLGAAAFFVLVFLCNLCICCSQKDKKFTQRFVVQRGGNYYARA